MPGRLRRLPAQRGDGQLRPGALLTELPDRQRTAVVLRHVVGLPYAEMSVVMACPEGTARTSPAASSGCGP